MRTNTMEYSNFHHRCLQLIILIGGLRMFRLLKLKDTAWVPPIVQKIMLRGTVISSLASAVVNMIYGLQGFPIHYQDFLASLHTGLSIIPFSVLLHHILRLWPRRIWTVRSEFVYSIVEFIAVTAYITTQIATGFVNVELIVLFAFFWSFVCTSFVFMIWNIRSSRYRTMGRTYEFFENDALKDSPRNSQIEPWSLLIGENTLKRRFGTDQILSRGLRAVVAILLLLAVIALGCLVLIVRPINHDLYFRTQWVGYDSGELPDVTLHAARVSNFDTDWVDLTVTWQPESTHVPCKSISSYSVFCNVASPEGASPPDSLTVTLNYTRGLQQAPTSSLRTGVYLDFDSEPDAPDVSSHGAGLPISLYPGFHLFGTMFYSYWETYASSEARSFGIPKFNRHLMGHVQALIPDPEHTTPNSDNSTATLRLTYRGGLIAQPDYKLEQEHSGDTVVSGFGLLGGAWTFINGLFATIFGCRLLLVLFGIKPLSIYGLVHLFQRRRSLVGGGYTLSAEEQSRTIAVLREHLLDDDGDIEANKAAEDNDRDGEQIALERVV